MQTWFSNIKEKPLEFIVGVCIFMVAVSGAAIKDVASTALAVIFIISLFYIRDWRASWSILEKTEKLIFIGFALYTLSALVSWANVDDSSEFVKQFGRYLRFTLIIPVYLMIRAKDMDLSRYLVAGIVISGFLYLAVALNSLHLRPEMPATGQYHHITFGDAIMLNAGVMGLMLLILEISLLCRVVVSISLLCALYAALLSQARGAWIVLPVYLLIFTVYLSVTSKKRLKKLILVAVAMLALVIITPIADMIEKRSDEAIVEISEFMHGEKFDTSVGGRLSMWNIAYDVWKEHPVIGTGLGDFDEDMVRYQAMGVYPGIAVHGSTHNIFVQAMAGTGSIGFIVLCYALVIAPIYHFSRTKKGHELWSMAGIVLVISYAIFGMSESWLLRAPAVSIYLAYMITLASLHRRSAASINCDET